jgi:isopenicillin-N N-acyltransferase-like protein
VVVLNAYTDLKDFLDEPDDGAAAAEGGCSAVAVKGPRVNFSAQTWDMHASAEPFALLLDVPGAAVPVRVFTVTGCVGMAGVNAARVSVMINNLPCRETNRHGLIWPGLVRLMLAERTAAAAVSVLAGNLPSSGHNYLVSDRTEAINVETTGRRHELTARIPQGANGVIRHTNHYLGTLRDAERTDRLGPTTGARLTALEDVGAEPRLSDLTTEAVACALFERGPTADCLCLAPPPPHNPHGGATCGGIAVDHAAGTAFAFRGSRASRRTTWGIDTLP